MKFLTKIILIIFGTDCAPYSYIQESRATSDRKKQKKISYTSIRLKNTEICMIRNTKYTKANVSRKNIVY